ncbi:MAG: hypothetical protein H6813_02255 [Phycisphaeraceae bacterium]|nr:hypothetical protein [Phycisphaeraceae bacterium]MCB9848860.1 hypothetical protein [Phycisphaeraceae bacterium]
MFARTRSQSALRSIAPGLGAALALAGVTLAGPGDTATASAADNAPPASLRIGDKAHDLAPEILWLRNMLVPQFDEGKVYILYLWSPDAPGSMGSFPQLHGLDQSLRADGVVTISIALDTTPGGFEAIDVIKSRAEFMAHSVAEDRGTFIQDHWYKPTGYDHLPVVFVIDQHGRIAFMDDKLMSIDHVVREVLAGNWDLDAARAEFDRVRDLENRMEPLVDEAMKAAGKGDWPQVVESAEQLLDADKVHYYKMAMTKFMLLLTKMNKPGDAYEWGYEIVDDHIRNDSGMLVTMAEAIVFTPNIPYRDFNLARKAAERADELTDGQLAQVKHALAASWMGLGQSGKAIEMEMEAVRLAPTTDAKKTYQEALDLYLKAPPAP